MALFRKLFQNYKKPPDGLLEISDRVYVFDYCFFTDVLEEDDYKFYLEGIMSQLFSQFPNAPILAFNFREGQRESQTTGILSQYDVTVMEYPRHYEGCPLLKFEMIHHFLKSCQSWLSLDQRNLLMMHCERGGWPLLAFMLSALLIYLKQQTGEQKTLEMMYSQAPRELLPLLAPLNPVPSQKRYLNYVSRCISLERPPAEIALTFDSIIFRMIPNFDSEGGCTPIFRVYGWDPLSPADKSSKVLFNTPKTNGLVRHLRQTDSDLVITHINCHIQGDVVLECVNLDHRLKREEMMFRVMFNTAFVISDILVLYPDQIDMQWNAANRFPQDFRVELLFSEMNAAPPLNPVELVGIEEQEGISVDKSSAKREAFFHVDLTNDKGSSSTDAEKFDEVSLQTAATDSSSSSETMEFSEANNVVSYDTDEDTATSVPNSFSELTTKPSEP